VATNPQTPIYEDRPIRLVPGRGRKAARRRRTGPLLVILMLAALVAITFYVLRPASKPARSLAAEVQVPMLPDGGELQIGALQINRTPVSSALSLAGNITNTGPHSLTGAIVTVTFRDDRGQVVEAVDRPIQGIDGGNCEVRNEFLRHPIKPNDLRFFCVTVDQVPTNWNRRIPDVRVLSATGE